jgi:apolipoprotein N-acyltransferase
VSFVEAPVVRSRFLLAWLAAGAALIALSQMRWGIGPLAFIAPVPLLHALREHRGVRARAWLLAALFVGYTVATLKIITPPLNPAFAVLFSVPFTVAYGTAYLASDALRRRGPPWVGVLAFPAACAVAEYALHRLTPFGSWAAAAYTQLESLPLLQLASLVGMAGVGFLVNLVASALEALWADPTTGRRSLAFAAAAVLLSFGFGAHRLASSPPGESGESVLVAAVGTDSTVSGWPLPSREELASVEARLFERTAEAAKAGARLIAWTEAANAVMPDDEAAFHRRLQGAAQTHQVELIAGYVLPLPGSPARYENKYVWVRPDGTLDHVYRKHHPVPGEPATPGVEAFRTVETAAGRATGAICYDFDFPALALAQARLGIDLAVVPSSDWRGIDPLHTQMAAVRAIEGGFSLLRSTRFGLSAGVDAYGRPRGWSSSFEAAPRVLLVALPRHRVPTLYTVIGDAFVGLCAGLLAGAAALGLAARRVARRAPQETAKSSGR